MDALKRNIHWLILGAFLVIAGIFSYNLIQNAEQEDRDARALRLEYHHSQTIKQFSSSVDKFAGLVSGMKSYVNLSPQFPTAIDFQKFVNNQYSDLNLDDSFVISYIDSDHIFKQSFTRTTMDPVNLVGNSVRNFRSDVKIARLDNLMTHDSIKMFSPLNLVEGWVGLPLNFRVHRNETSIGYVAPILSLKTILNDIYKNDLNHEFIYHFSTEENYDFDREQTYNNTEYYNKNLDPEYYKNFNIDSTQFLYTTKPYYGFKIKIGTAYREPFVTDKSFINLILFWYLTFSILAILVAWQVQRLKNLSKRILKKNNLLVKQGEEIIVKNEQLQTLNNTQTKFFSIIGHDIKQPLSAIEGLLTLLQYEEIKDPDLAEIIKNLTKSTKNTTNLLNNLLRWAMSQTGELKFSPTQLDLNVVLEEVVSTLFFQAKEKSIRLIYQPTAVINYYGDKDMLSTLFRNIVSNAIKFTNLGGTIVIDSRLKDNHIVITIADSGIGMTIEEVDSLFNLDAQVSTVGTTGEMGTGLGLILSQLFVKNHGGELLVESEKSVGTTFTIKLPK